MKEKTNRREFLERTAALSSFTIVPRPVLGGPGYRAPSDRLNIAGIGVGGMGAGDLRDMETENIVALCDVDWDRAAKTFQKYPKATRHRDFRKMLEQEKNIDAVMVATPDHTHAVATMAAIKAGKHVYCEKPLTHSVYEARQVAEAAREAGVATQMGTQGHALETVRVLCEWIWDGAIGQVREVHAWTTHAVWPQGIGRPRDTHPVPGDLDWDLWLGPAPFRPYHPVYAPTQWRGWWDFGTGAVGDMACHIFDPIFWALKLGHPESVEARHSYFVPKGLNWDKKLNTETYPRASIIYYHFPARGDLPPVKLVWYDGGLLPEAPAELEEGLGMGDWLGGVLYIGDRGTIVTGAEGAPDPRIIPETKMQEYEPPPKTLPRSIGHRQEWIEACKGGATPGMAFDKAGPLTETVLLGNVSIRAGKKLNWDARNMKFPNAPEAEAYLHRKYRKGWTL